MPRPSKNNELGSGTDAAEMAVVNAPYVASYIHMGNKIGTLVGLTARGAITSTI